MHWKPVIFNFLNTPFHHRLAMLDGRNRFKYCTHWKHLSREERSVHNAGRVLNVGPGIEPGNDNHH